MCGIYGFVALAERGSYEPALEDGLNALVHRGPDEVGLWRGDGVALGMRRLSIIDLSTGQQPIWNEDGTLGIVYNGELYNFLDLRPELERRGHVFRTQSDTEVVLHAYEEWGAACLTRFNGMFALAIWDASKRTLFLARDRLGEKPLYVYRDADRLIFASEIKAILADPTVPRRVSLVGLSNYLAFGHAVAPHTMYERVTKLLPGHCLTVRAGAVEIVEYWDVGSEPPDRDGLDTEEGQAERILNLLNDSVRRRMIADVPVGAFLSGGVDSSAVVALMARHAGSQRVKTFSVGFDVGGAYNELPDARRVAEYIGTEHHELVVDHTQLTQALRRLVYHYDEPFADAAGFPVYLVSGLARQHVKVALGGDGADELFGGYRRYAADQFAGGYQMLPSKLAMEWLPRLAHQLPRLRRVKRTLDALRIADPARRYAAWLEVFTREQRHALLRPDVRDGVSEHDPAGIYPAHYLAPDGPARGDHLNRLLYVDVKTWLPDAYLEKLDKATMARSLEARLPVLDHRLVELAFAIPGRSKVRGWSTKRVFKRAVAPLVPPEVLKKPKHGFSVPTDPWFRGELREFAADILLGDRARKRGYFEPSEVERLWRGHASGRHEWDLQLWVLLNFELWHRIFIDGERV